MTRFLVAGEALVDIVIMASGQRREHPGGSPLNVAVGLARLEQPTELVTRLGADAYGRLIAEHVRDSGVHLDPACIDDEPTSTATARLDAEGRASYTFDLHWRLPEVAWGEDPDHLHIGSIGAFLEPGAGATLELATRLRAGATVSFDPNIRSDFTGTPQAARRRVETIVAGTDVVKVSDEDLAWLVPGADPTEVAARWLDLGPAVVVVTCGGKDVVAACRAGTTRVPVPQVEVADTVGAGDAFTSGLLDALARAGLLGAANRERLCAVAIEDLQGVLAAAARVAALTCARPGADPPTRAELQSF